MKLLLLFRFLVSSFLFTFPISLVSEPEITRFSPPDKPLKPITKIQLPTMKITKSKAVPFVGAGGSGGAAIEELSGAEEGRARPAFRFSGSRLSAEEMAPFLSGSHLPEQIVYYDENHLEVLLPQDSTEGQIFAGTLNVVSEGFARKIAQERRQEAAARNPAFPPEDLADASGKKLNPQDYKLGFFRPGKRNDKVTTLTWTKNLHRAIKGPDYSLEDISPGDTDRLEELRSRVVSFGHGGEMILELQKNGMINDGVGADFVIYENVFRFGKGKLYQELAYVGVSETLNDRDFKWFPCHPKQHQIKACAGVVPTEQGGDAFDLAQIGVRRIKYIKIKDIGYTFTPGPIGPNTEGFDLDAIGVINGYVQ